MRQSVPAGQVADPNIPQQLRDLIRQWDEGSSEPSFVAGKTRIRLSAPSFGWEEIYESLDSLLSTNVTMGTKVRRFEKLFAEYLGVRNAVMVNSGSSANLLALSVLANPALGKPLRPGDEVITPALTWATTVFPIQNLGAVPVLVDVDLETFNVIPEEIERAITAKTRAIMPVHLMGNPCDMDMIMAIAQRHDLAVIEDTCEAHGAEYRGQKVGSFGDIATFSFFFTHHISTIEGGMLVTDNDEYGDLARALRAFGWIRDLSNRDAIAERNPDIDPRFLFANTGYNLRPTEIQGAFGIHQIGKLDAFVETRRENARYWRERLRAFENLLVPQRETAGARHVWFGNSLTVTPRAPFDRREIVMHLEARGVETRPIMAGNISEQPAMRFLPHRQVGDLPNARFIHRNSFFFGNHHRIGPPEREAIADYIEEFINEKAGV